MVMVALVRAGEAWGSRGWRFDRVRATTVREEVGTAYAQVIAHTMFRRGDADVARCAAVGMSARRRLLQDGQRPRRLGVRDERTKLAPACAYCDAPATSVDHLIPRLEDGPDCADNLVVREHDLPGAATPDFISVDRERPWLHVLRRHQRRLWSRQRRTDEGEDDKRKNPEAGPGERFSALHEPSSFSELFRPALTSETTRSLVSALEVLQREIVSPSEHRDRPLLREPRTVEAVGLALWSDDHDLPGIAARDFDLSGSKQPRVWRDVIGAHHQWRFCTRR